MKPKYKSSKFWLSVAAFLSSLGVGFLGYFSDNTPLAITGIVCTALASGIYNYCESKVDAASASANISTTTTNVNASTNAKEVVATILGGTNEVVPTKGEKNE